MTPLFDIAYLIVAINIICFISELNFTVHLVVEGAHHYPVETVFGVVASYRLAVVEFKFFLADLIDVDRSHREVNSAFIMACYGVPPIRTIYQIVRDRWVVRGLLHIEVSSISAFGLVSLS